MRSGTDRDAPQPIEPPTGALEVYSYDPKTGRATLAESCGEDIARAEKTLRRLDGPACRARGGVVIGVKYGTAPSLIGPMKAAVMVTHIAAKTASPRKAEPVKARVAVERIEIEVVEDELPTAPTNTDVEPKVPSTTSNDEEPMTTDETPRCEGHDCEEPRGVVRTDTKPELEGFCPRHRKIAVDRARSSGVSLKEAAASLREGRAVEEVPPKAARKTPTAKSSRASKPASVKAPKSAPKRSNDPGDVLFEALRDLRGDQLTEERVREIVREELSSAFASLRGRS